MQNTVELTGRDLLNAAYRIGKALDRKFEREDMTPVLRQAARTYAASYEGDLPWALEMHDIVVGGAGAFLTDGQSKGMLNVMMADARKRLADRAPKAAAVASSEPAREIPLGTFTVVFPDGHVTIRLQKPQDKSKEGVVYAKYLAGPDNTADFQYFASVVNGNIRAKGYERQVVALKVVLTSTGSELGKMGLAYALASSNCFYCGRTLTVPASIHSGMGPDCAAKHGGFYGEPEAPTASEPEAPAPVVAPEPEPAPVARKSAYEEADRANRAAQAHIDEVRSSGRKLSYEDIFGTEENY